MKRQITIYESAQNGKITVFNDVECNTLSELKALLRAKSIDYNGMEFIEGVTNTKLLSDDSRIPTDIPFKGKVTNNVFINILKKDSKISSGIDYETMSRSELLKAAKEFAEDILSIFHKNFTQVKSCELITFLEGKENEESEGEESEEHCEENAESAFHKCKVFEMSTVVEKIVDLVKLMGCEKEVVEAIMEDEDEDENENDDREKSAFSEDDIREFLNK